MVSALVSMVSHLKNCFKFKVRYYTKVYTAELLGYDDDKDVAVLKVDKSGLRPIPLGRSAALLVGQKVFAIGNPFGLVEQYRLTQFIRRLTQG